MFVSPVVITINDSIESSILESAQKIPTAVATNAQDDFSIQKKSTRIDEPDLGANKFASLITTEGEEDLPESEKETGSMDLMTPFGKTILPDRPVKPLTKAKEMHWQSRGRGRGNRGRGEKGGCG
ncbi:unnamed protein product [Microthlaspi erraticum]|uniref:Uncharacterized protein n=1 Tax=Microthlaspi erraticum TaxID=1685480 RepID=A0A6D2J7Q4_9BRAS|nr:unnamed protein product [Microthlaspi erraticum]CAA7057610.1 unnamed protein product [Microthlaspi erraticum]